MTYSKIKNPLAFHRVFTIKSVMRRIRWVLFFEYMNMLFNFHSFIEELREKDDKKEIVTKYEQYYGPIQWDIKEQLWYTEYLSRFSYVEMVTPEELGNDFDWELLQQLVISSFSSDYELKHDVEKGNNDLYIAVKSGDQSVVKTVSELRSFQMLRLYEIYVEEQMNLQILKHEEEGEKAIDMEREMRLKKWNAVLDTMDRAQMASEVKADQEEKLDNLLGKL